MAAFRMRAFAARALGPAAKAILTIAGAVRRPGLFLAGDGRARRRSSLDAGRRLR